MISHSSRFWCDWRWLRIHNSWGQMLRWKKHKGLCSWRKRECDRKKSYFKTFREVWSSIYCYSISFNIIGAYLNTIYIDIRYMNLILDGEKFGIDVKYIQWLKDQPVYQKSCLGIGIGLFLLLTIMLINLPILLVLRLITYFGYKYPLVWYMNILQYRVYYVLTCWCCYSGASCSDRESELFLKGSSTINVSYGTIN